MFKKRTTIFILSTCLAFASVNRTYVGSSNELALIEEAEQAIKVEVVEVVETVEEETVFNPLPDEVVTQHDGSRVEIVYNEEVVARLDEPSIDITYEEDPIVTMSVSDLETLEEKPEMILTEEEIELIALVTMAEAEGESEYGKRLVIDTILNRVDSDVEYMPDTVHEVIYQPNQFSPMWNGRIDRCYVREDIYQLVKEELVSRTNDEVMFFHAGRYGEYGTPMFSEGNHYFSSLD